MPFVTAVRAYTEGENKEAEWGGEHAGPLQCAAAGRSQT